ncbi:MAG: SDR family oxidoreductase [Solirubrobacterales bacterium]
MAGIVTGAARGIGRAAARRLSDGGAGLVLADLRDAWEDTSLADLSEDRTVLAPADVRRPEDLEVVARRCREAFGRIDFVVANAGTCDTGSLFDGDPQVWRSVVDTNLLGVAHTLRAVLPAMREQGSGHVIIMASVSGRISYSGQPLYLASKWGVVGLGYALREEVAPLGIRVTLVEPGLVDTELARATLPADSSLAGQEALAPADVAEAVAFALRQPARVAVNEIVVRPTRQEL